MLHNLLPKEKKRKLMSDYVLRLASTAVFLCAGAVLIGAVSLVPSYIHITSALSAFSEDSEAHGTNSGDKAVAVLARTAGLLESLRARATAEPMTDLLIPILAARPRGIEVTGITFERPTLTFTIRGIAKTREALVAYKRAVEEHTRTSMVSSPISNLTKSTNLEFTLSVVLRAPDK